MMLLGKRIVVSELTKRNLCLLPGIALFGWVLLAESCSPQKSITPAREPDFGAAKAVVLQEAAHSPARAATDARSARATRPLALGERMAELH